MSKVEETIANLIHKHKNRLKYKIWKWSYNIDDEEKDDILQDLYLKVSKVNGVSIEDEDKTINYIERALRTLLIDRYRVEQRKGIKVDLLDTDSVEDFLYDDTTSINIKEIIGEKLYETFILYVQGFKHEEIAVKLNSPLITIKTRIHRAKKKLKPYRDNFISDKL